jgi:protein TonB
MSTGGDSDSSDRLLITLVLAASLHAVLILGVSFDLSRPERIAKPLDITLVKYARQPAPAKADYLAQSNRLGSGSAQEKGTPAAEPRSPVGDAVPVDKPALYEPPATRPRSLRKETKSVKKIAAETGLTNEDAHAAKEPPKISAHSLSQQIAEFSAELTKAQNEATRRPKIRYINSVNAHQYRVAAYEKAWQDKVERIGNLNYPDEARRKKLSGDLLLSVGINQDGSVHSIKVRRSSGYSTLDDAAVRIVRLAAPFAPWPDGLRDEADVLVITRTWQFLSDHRMKTDN